MSSTAELISRPAEAWATILGQGETFLDDELRRDDREYLVSMLSSTDCLSFDPENALAEAQLVASLSDIVPGVHQRRDVEIVRWQHVAHRLFITVGWFASLLAEDPRRGELFPACIDLSRTAFGKLALSWHEKRRQALLYRFQKEYMRYLDLLLCAHEIAEQRPIAFRALRPLAQCGSRYALLRITPSN